MITNSRYIKLHKETETPGVVFVLQIGSMGETLRAPARWCEKVGGYVHNRTGETLAMYDVATLGPQLERLGIEFSATLGEG